jgi:murein DD-endopeptidase MepM/ murein hydrolase activator NlpD
MHRAQRPGFRVERFVRVRRRPSSTVWTAERAPDEPTPRVSASPGRRRAPRPPRRGRSFTQRALVGAAAVVAGAVVAATVGPATSGEDDSTLASSSPATLDGRYVSRAATAELASRDATRLSRAATRPATLPSNKEKHVNVNKADRRREEQFKLLRQTANNAEKTAKRLSRHDAKRASSREWVYPTTNFHLTEMFGVPGPHWASGYHTGIDFATAYGTPVVAVANGTVVQTGWDGAYGNQIRLQLPNGDQVWYNHLSSIQVTRGQPVLKGQALGRVGETGNAFGYHLHFEYRLSTDLTSAVDPLPFFAQHGLTLK